ncbi:MAG: TIGR03936 family radical SAM-associated protein, partial [Candidatus Saganbacteria bacterium]|nr:TIGR03936 family radical SAM-associated protein [Candidatus Saganbacteria bacterium]
MQRLRIKYTKEDPVRFIGHLDFIKIFEKAMRRTDLPVAYSQGFNPRMQISWGLPLALGITSDGEIA